MSYREESYYKPKGYSQIATQGVDVSKFSLEDLKNLWRKTIDDGFHGICFSMYEDGQKPGDDISFEQVERRVKILKPHVDAIRSFSCIEGNEHVPVAAKKQGLKTLVGAWLSNNKEDNEKEIESLISLAKAGYVPVRHTPSLWRYHTHPITFTLVVDDFGVKYEKLEHFNHLRDALRTQYEVTTDMTGSKYLGLTITWNYEKRYVDIAMPGYVYKALQRFAHEYSSNRRQNAPHQWNKPIYGRKGPQYVDDEAQKPTLPQDGKKLV